MSERQADRLGRGPHERPPFSSSSSIARIALSSFFEVFSLDVWPDPRGQPTFIQMNEIMKRLPLAL